nr:MAG TPA: peroxiredoxin-like protein [Caudoviricetes sp.]
MFLLPVPAPPNITFIAIGTFAVQRAACGSAACPKGWPNNRKEK